MNPNPVETAPALTVVEPASETPAASEISKEQVHKVMTEVGTVKGTGQLRDILKAVGAARLSEIKPEDYPKVLELCSEAMGN